MAARVSDLTTVVYSGDYRADALLDNVAPWNFWPDGRNVLYFTFDVSAGSVIDTETSAPVIRFNAQQQQATRAILQYAATVTGLAFVEVSSSALADVHFGATDLQGASVAGLASSYWRYSSTQDGMIASLEAESLIYLDNVEQAGINSQPVAGNIGYEVLLHEVGHMLGLSHPFAPESPRPLPVAEDHTGNTVMSYTDRGAPKSQFQSYDLLALDWIYGRDGVGGAWGYNSVNGPSLAFSPPPARIVGTSKADVFRSTSANETFDGLAGTDTLMLRGLRAGYTLAGNGSSWQVADRTAGRDGTDTVLQTERLQFSDFNVALDLDGVAGATARVLGAVLGEAAVGRRESVGIGLRLADDGVSMADLSRLALKVMLGPAYTNEQVVNLVYANLFHAGPDAATRAALTGLLDTGAYSVDVLVAVAAASDVNAANIGLVGLQAHGLEYLPA